MMKWIILTIIIQVVLIDQGYYYSRLQKEYSISCLTIIAYSVTISLKNYLNQKQILNYHRFPNKTSEHTNFSKNQLIELNTFINDSLTHVTKKVQFAPPNFLSNKTPTYQLQLKKLNKSQLVLELSDSVFMQTLQINLSKNSYPCQTEPWQEYASYLPNWQFKIKEIDYEKK